MGKPIKREPNRINPPKDQSFAGGITIIMREHRHNHATGNRDIPGEIVSGRFKDGESVWLFYSQRKKNIRRKKID